MPLTDGDTCYYGTIARNIVRTGDWQSLTFGGTGYFDTSGLSADQAGKDFVDKPPLSIWPIAVSYKLFGISDWSAKAWHALLALICILLTYMLAKECYSASAAFWGGATLLTSILMFYAGLVPQQDVPVVFCLLLGFLGFLRYRRTKKRRYYYLVWLSMAMNLMVRGLPGVAFIAGPILLFWFFNTLGKETRPNLAWPNAVGLPSALRDAFIWFCRFDMVCSGNHTTGAGIP